MFAGTTFVKRGYAAYGQIIIGGGGAILYLSAYAAFNLYALIERPTAFGLMVAITALIAWLADRHRSQGLAVFAVGGGFVTPFLLPGTTDAQVALFTYDGILIAGAAVLSHRRDWPFLHVVSYVLTLMTVAGWADRFYAPEKYLRTEIYLTIYCAMFLYILREMPPQDERRGEARRDDAVDSAGGLLHGVARRPADHDTALMIWLVALMLAGAVAASWMAPSPDW